MGKNYVESSLKRFLKRKVKITLGLVVAFMITGNAGYAENVTVGTNLDSYVNEEKIIELDDVLIREYELTENIGKPKTVKIGNSKTEKVNIKNYYVGMHTLFGFSTQNSVSTIEGNDVNIDNLAMLWSYTTSYIKNNKITINAKNFKNKDLNMGDGENTTVEINAEEKAVLGDILYGKEKPSDACTYTRKKSNNSLSISSNNVQINSINFSGNTNRFNITGNDRVTVKNGIISWAFADTDFNIQGNIIELQGINEFINHLHDNKVFVGNDNTSKIIIDDLGFARQVSDFREPKTGKVSYVSAARNNLLSLKSSDYIKINNLKVFTAEGHGSKKENTEKEYPQKESDWGAKVDINTNVLEVENINMENDNDFKKEDELILNINANKVIVNKNVDIKDEYTKLNIDTNLGEIAINNFTASGDYDIDIHNTDKIKFENLDLNLQRIFYIDNDYLITNYMKAGEIDITSNNLFVVNNKLKAEAGTKGNLSSNIFNINNGLNFYLHNGEKYTTNFSKDNIFRINGNFINIKSQDGSAISQDTGDLNGFGNRLSINGNEVTIFGKQGINVSDNSLEYVIKKETSRFEGYYYDNVFPKLEEKGTQSLEWEHYFKGCKIEDFTNEDGTLKKEELKLVYLNYMLPSSYDIKRVKTLYTKGESNLNLSSIDKDGNILKDSLIDITGDTNGIYVETIKDGKSNVDIKSNTINISGNGGTLVSNTSLDEPQDNELKLYGAIENHGGNVTLTGNNLNIISHNSVYGDLSLDKRKEYVAILSRKGGTVNLNGNANIISENGIALYATNLKENESKGSSIITVGEKGKEQTHNILGDIISGKNGHITVNGIKNIIGNNNLDLTPSEVMAANGGTVDLNMKEGVLTAKVDDYQEAGEFGKTTFRNNKFYQDIESSGEVNLNLENGTWYALGQSFVTNVTGKNININMSKEKGTSLHIKNLEGNGNIVMALDSDAVENKNVKTEMLYIDNIANNSKHNIILADAKNVLDLEEGQKLRFATIKGKNKQNIDFGVSEVTGMGIRNVAFNVEHDTYDENAKDNENYNGESGKGHETELKPGNDFVNENYGNNSGDIGENYYITKVTKEEVVNPEKEPDNEISKTIVSMAKGNYNSLVYMDNLNKRLGDIRFADGDEGIWVRTRNDRVGEDNVYRLHNYMTQVGYDKKYAIKNGNEHRGIAFEYSQGSMEYKEFDGESNIDKYLVSLYNTRIYNNGLYTDFLLKGGRADSDFDIYAETNATGELSKVKVNGEYKNLFLGANAEIGKKFNINENWYFEPQTQLQYTFIDSTDYTTNQNTKVNLEEIHSLIGRAGFRLGHDYSNSTIYIKADANHEFMGDQKVEAKDITGRLEKTYYNDNTWFDIGVGGSKDITPDFNVYMDIEKQFGTDKDNKSWQFNVGFRYEF